MTGVTGSRPRVVVCGTRFGRVYLAAFRQRDFPFELAGIVARGSERSRACAERYGVPLYSSPGEVPDDVSIACVVVSAAMNGGRGTDLAKAFLARGIHVLQEHPLHHDELADCLAFARRHGVVYRMNTHYVHVAPVHRFIAAARELLSHQDPVFVDAMCAFPVTYSLADILGRALGRLQPWRFAEPVPLARPLRQASDAAAPFRGLDGVVGGVPLTLRIQNQLHPTDPDNYYHLFHRISLGTEGGNLTLVNTHGPVLWTPRPHMPADVKNGAEPEDSAAEYLRYPSATVLGPPESPIWREIMGSLWPRAVGRALGELQQAIGAAEDPLRHGQYHLSLCRLVQDLTGQCGQPEFIRDQAPRPLPADWLVAAAATSEGRGPAA